MQARTTNVVALVYIKTPSFLSPLLSFFKIFSGRKLEDEHQLYIRKLRETPKACSYRGHGVNPLVQQIGITPIGW
jgi:hypothetical protein